MCLLQGAHLEGVVLDTSKRSTPQPSPVPVPVPVPMPSAQDIALLWQDRNIRAAYDQRHQYWLLDAAAYYFENIHRSACGVWVQSQLEYIIESAYGKLGGNS